MHPAPADDRIAHYHKRIERDKRQQRQRIWALPSYYLMNRDGLSPVSAREDTE